MEEIKDIEDTKAIAGSPEEATHYHGAVEPIELMQSILTPEEFKGFLKGNMIKYAFRAGRKAGESAEKDRNKYLTYAEWLRTFESFGTIYVNGDCIEKGKING